MSVSVCMRMNAERLPGALAGTAMARRILFHHRSWQLLKFNHSGSAVIQITRSPSTPSHYPDCNWIVEKPRGRALPANLLLICLWLVWPEPFCWEALCCPQAVPDPGKGRGGGRGGGECWIKIREQDHLEGIRSSLRARSDIAGFLLTELWFSLGMYLLGPPSVLFSFSLNNSYNEHGRLHLAVPLRSSCVPSGLIMIMPFYPKPRKSVLFSMT